MTNEIKEIIKLGCEEEIEVKYFAKDDSLVNTYMDYSQLLDYITNLQEKYEEANGLWIKKYEDYKSRNEKAIEYINKLSNEPNAFGHYGIDSNCKKYLLKILNGDDK